MKLLIIIAFLLAITATAVQYHQVPSGAVAKYPTLSVNLVEGVRDDGSTYAYYIGNDQVEYATARDYCTSIGLQLLTLKTEEKQREIEAIVIGNANGETQILWLWLWFRGAIGGPTGYGWGDNDPVTYENFHSKNQDIRVKGIMDGRYGYKWNFDRYWANYTFICEPIAPAPTPTSLPSTTDCAC